MRLLALDVGTKRIGLAISDPLGLTARPLETIPREGSLVRLQAICFEQQVEKLVVGVPYILDTKEISSPELQDENHPSKGPAAKAIESFAQKLSKATDLDVCFVDEQFSSKEAEEMLRSKKLKNSNRHSRVDQLSAAIILERYLEENMPNPL